MVHDTVDPAEVAKFEAMAAEWWDPNGKFKPLHMLNPVPVGLYHHARLPPSSGGIWQGAAVQAGLRILDIGCGGGLLSEPMARLGADGGGRGCGGAQHSGGAGACGTVGADHRLPPHHSRRHGRRRVSSSTWC